VDSQATTESLLRLALDESDRIFAMSVDMICVAGFDGFFKRVNPAFSRVLGYTETELLSRPFVSFVHPDDVAATTEHAAQLTNEAHDSSASFRNRYRCADGSYRWLEWASDSVCKQQRIYAVARDVTAQRATEERLADYAKELERSNAELQTFAYVASHDLQEPLRAVAGCMTLLAERMAGALDEKSQELMTHAVEGAKRMQGLINDLLAYSRVGSKGINRQWIDPTIAAQNALKQLEIAALESHAVITITNLPRTFADSAQLTQLFQNLIGNAIKFRSDQRPVEIHVSAQASGAEVIFSVKDNGIGIAAEYQQLVFAIFQRLNRRSDYSGTGIGLAICKKIVERHGGRIWIESVADQGSTFLFSIPNEKES
jgi:PAS domain S-box-containing protein